MKWSYQDPNRTRPFEVPNDIVDLSQLKNSDILKIGDFIKLDNHSDISRNSSMDFNTPEALVTIYTVYKNSRKRIYSLCGIMLDDHLNFINGIAWTPDEGIVGLGDRSTDNLYVKSGVYSLWNRGTPINKNDNKQMPASNSYGSNPFWIAMSEDHSWYGVYSNLASA